MRVGKRKGVSGERGGEGQGVRVVKWCVKGKDPESGESVGEGKGRGLITLFTIICRLDLTSTSSMTKRQYWTSTDSNHHHFLF